MVTVEHLTKRYGGFTAVNDLSFCVEGNGVYGFLGPNGAGKSTTMNIMTGCLSASEGHVLIGGYDIFEEPGKAKRIIGYLPEQPPLYMNETPAEYLQFVGEAKGIKGQELRRQVKEVIERTGIGDVKDKLISKLSKGYKQRVGIAQALLGNPGLIILDEPTVGLDPLQIIEIRELVRRLGETHTVLFSSHILSEVQTICEKVLIIAKGKLIAFDEPEKLEKLLHASNEVTLMADAPREAVEIVLDELCLTADKDPEKTGEGYLRLRIRTGERDAVQVCRELFYAFAKREWALLELTSRSVNLEDVFIELTEGEDPAYSAASGENAGMNAGDAKISAEADSESEVPEQ